MERDRRDLLEMLRVELNYLEQGGYARERQRTGELSPFRHSYACLNHANPARPHACRHCALIEFVPSAKRIESAPCHHIPITAERETVRDLMENSSPERLTRALVLWLRHVIARTEAAH